MSQIKDWPSFAAYIAVTAAILGFGTQGAFVKSNRIKAADVHPFVVTALFSSHVAFLGFSLGVLSSLVFVGDCPMSPLANLWQRAIWPACTYAPGNILLLWCCRRIGVALAVGIVSAATTIVSFGLGVGLGMNEGSNRDFFERQIPGALGLVLGAAMMTYARLKATPDQAVESDVFPGHLYPSEAYSALTEPLSGASSPRSSRDHGTYSETNSFALERRSSQVYFSPSIVVNPRSRIKSPMRRKNKSESRGSADTQEEEDSITLQENDNCHGNESENHRVISTQISRLGSSYLDEIDSYATLGNVPGIDVFGILVAVLSGMLLGIQGVFWGCLFQKKDEITNCFVIDILISFMLIQWPCTLLILLLVAICIVLSDTWIKKNSVDYNYSREEEEEEKAMDADENDNQHESSFCDPNDASISDKSFLFTAIKRLYLEFMSLFRNGDVLIALPYAFGGAICFCTAVSGQVFSVVLLPEVIAMPLTQLNLIVASLWGIAYFREIESPHLIAHFFLAVCVALSGAAVLASGSG